MAFIDLAAERCSIKNFDSNRKVEEEKLALILEAGRVAPTAKNNQPQRIYVARSEEALRKLNELSPCVYGATTVLVIGYDETEEFKNPQEPGVHSGVEDASIVATQMMLEATDLGLGSCWVNLMANSKVAKALELPESVKVVLLMPIGYASEGAGALKNHFSRKPLYETVKYI